MAADGELSSRRAAQVREHLLVCGACRTRRGEIEATMADLIDLRHRELIRSCRRLVVQARFSRPG